MRTTFIPLLFTLFLIIGCRSGEDTKESSSGTKSEETGESKTTSIELGRVERKIVREHSHYHYLVDELLKGNIKEYNFLELRMEFTKTSYFNPYVIDASIQKMKELYDEQNYEEVIKVSREIMPVKAAQIQAHFYAKLAFKAVGNEALYDFHTFVMHNLIQSIIGENNGLTPETAFKVISPYEEFSVMEYLEYTPGDRKLVEIDGSSYDVFTIEMEDGVTVKLYFNIDIPLKWLEEHKEDR